VNDPTNATVVARLATRLHDLYPEWSVLTEKVLENPSKGQP
jgi:hypothetical protein